MEFAELIITPKLDGVILHSPFHETTDATLCITGHHLILSSRKDDAQEIWLLLQSIDLVEKKVVSTNSNNQTGGLLILKCKDLRIIQLEINHNEDLHNVYLSLERLSNLDNPFLLYPFFYRPMYTILEEGYTLFKPEIEFAKLLASDEWRITNVNKDYSLCPTYGASLVVPKSIDDETLITAAGFREGGRFPILSYRHENGAILLRSGQPLLSNNNKRCRCDEKILNGILGTNMKGYIIDTRSTNYANQCRTKGGGTEPDGNYSQWRRIHKNLDKISNCSGVNESLCKLVDACNDVNCTSDKWMSRLENSNWLTHVQNSLNAACLVAQCLDQEGVPVLVHGTHGLDSTLLVTSITQVILNPDCRTVRGLQALIEREWLQGGFPFQLRHSKSCYSNIKTKQNQPTFLVFLDCVQQLHHQFPCSFEFTTNMLIQLFEHSYFSQFGTFLGNCEADRERLRIPKATTSLWSYLNRPDILTSLLNPMYEPNKMAIWPSVAPVSLVLWYDLYLRWVIDQTPKKQMVNKIQSLIQNDKNLRSKVTKLRKQLVDLQRELELINNVDETVIGNENLQSG